MLLCLDVYEGFKFKCPISPAIAAVPCQLLAVRTGTYDINGKARNLVKSAVVFTSQRLKLKYSDWYVLAISMIIQFSSSANFGAVRRSMQRVNKPQHRQSKQHAATGWRRHVTVLYLKLKATVGVYTFKTFCMKHGCRFCPLLCQCQSKRGLMEEQARTTSSMAWRQSPTLAVSGGRWYSGHSKTDTLHNGGIQLNPSALHRKVESSDHSTQRWRNPEASKASFVITRWLEVMDVI